MTDRPRIAMLIPWADAGGIGGGIARLAEALCKSLSSRDDLELELYSLWSTQTELEQRLRLRLSGAGVPLTIAAPWSSAHPYRSLAVSLARLAPVLRARNIALLHSHHEFGDLAAATLRILGAVPLLARTVHNEEWLWRPLAQRTLTCGLYPFVFSTEAGVSREIVARLDGRRLARRLGRKAMVLHNAIDLERFERVAHNRATARRRLGLPSDGPVIGSIGRLHRQKGYAYFLAAGAEVVQQWPNACFVLVGEGDEEAALRRQAEDLGISHRVLFAGSRADVEQVLTAFDLFVSSSLYEGLPTVVLESMATGVPVIATDVTGTREVIANGINGWLVPPEDPTRLADAIKHLLAHPDYGRALAERALGAVQDFSISAVAEGYQALYRQLLGQAGT